MQTASTGLLLWAAAAGRWRRTRRAAAGSIRKARCRRWRRSPLGDAAGRGKPRGLPPVTCGTANCIKLDQAGAAPLRPVTFSWGCSRRCRSTRPGPGRGCSRPSSYRGSRWWCRSWRRPGRQVEHRVAAKHGRARLVIRKDRADQEGVLGAHHLLPGGGWYS
jgi:hypothetical protein